jgi:hypothetical protein
MLRLPYYTKSGNYILLQESKMAEATGANTATSLDALFYKIYAPDLKNLIPKNKFLYQTTSFGKQNRELGDKYIQPVKLTHEHGVTYNADGTAFTLNDAIAGVTAQAQVQGSEILLRSKISYQAAAKASSDRKAFVKSTKHLIDDMWESSHKLVELELLYGQSGYATTSNGTATSSTTETVAFTTASFAPAIWAGMENFVVQFRKSSDDTLVSSGDDSKFTVTTVNVAAKTILFTGTATGCTALHSAIDTSSGGSGVAHYVLPYGNYGKGMTGMDGIITNTGSLFNINASSYNLWKGQTYAVGGALTMSDILNGHSEAIGMGLDEDTCLICNPLTWNNVNVEVSGNRRFDSSYAKSKGVNGFESIDYNSTNGVISIIAHPYVKPGECFAFPKSKWMRIGEQDISFDTPGYEGQIFRQLDGAAGYEFRNYTSQAIFTTHPARSIKFTGIVNT